MKLTKMLITCLGALALAACSGDENSGGPITSPTSGNDSATVTWTEPRTNIDNSVLAPGEITKYRIYLSQDQNNLSSFIEIDATLNPNSYTINYDENLIPPNTIIYVAMTAINDQGIESNFSEVVNFNSN
jgi:hypothetical protein